MTAFMMWLTEHRERNDAFVLYSALSCAQPCLLSFADTMQSVTMHLDKISRAQIQIFVSTVSFAKYAVAYLLLVARQVMVYPDYSVFYV